MCDAETLAYYRRHTPIYAAGGPGGVSRCLARFLSMLPDGARILELGCGGGIDAEAMIAAGFEVDATEAIAEIAKKAERRLGRPVRVMRFDQLDADADYDAVWASASLIHVPRPALPDVLRLVFRALKPGGLHFATYKSGGEEGRDRSGRYYNYLDEGRLIDIYRMAAQWRNLQVSAYEGGGFDGGQGPWVSIAARRPTASIASDP
jgi:SAM-dependent methyltransferase